MPDEVQQVETEVKADVAQMEQEATPIIAQVEQDAINIGTDVSSTFHARLTKLEAWAEKVIATFPALAHDVPEEKK